MIRLKKLDCGNPNFKKLTFQKFASKVFVCFDQVFSVPPEINY